MGMENRPFSDGEGCNGILRFGKENGVSLVYWEFGFSKETAFQRKLCFLAR
jgi:hypothetical protein